MGDSELPLLFFMLPEIWQTASHTEMLVQQGLMLNMKRNQEHGQNSDGDSSESDTNGPGKGNAIAGVKSLYARRTASHVYKCMRLEDPDDRLFERTVHVSVEEFDALYGVTKSHLEEPFNVRNEHTLPNRVPRRRRLSAEEMLFLLLDILGGSNEGGLGVQRHGHVYGISTGTVSNYFRHALFALYKTLKEIQPPLISWPLSEERSDMEGLILGFPKCVFFIDGNKTKRWRPVDNHEQERAYDGYKRAHVWSILVYCDLYGRFIRLEISDKGAESDRTLYTNSSVYLHAEQYLEDGQHGMADMGFGGDGKLVVPFKRNESTNWMHRVSYNRYIRTQRMVNEWGIGHINNRYRIFLGRWPFEKSLFPIAYETAALLSNWSFRRRGFALMTKEMYERKLEAHRNRTSSEEDEP